MRLDLKAIRIAKQSKKALAVKIGVLLFALFAFTVSYFWQSRNIVRVELGEGTLLRQGSYMVADSGLHKYQSTNPHYSIYTYDMSIGPRDWHRLDELILGFGQVRAGDVIYIESVSVKQTFFAERRIDNADLLSSITQFNRSELALNDNGQLRLEALGASPSFCLPSDILKTAVAPDPAYMLGILLLLFFGMAIILLVPNRAYALIWGKAVDFVKTFGQLSLPATAAFAVCVVAILLYYFDARLGFWHIRYYTVHFTVSVAAQIAVLVAVFFAFKSKCRQIEFLEDEKSANCPWACYLLLLILSLAVYIPAMFTTPYFHVDECLVAEAAMQYLDTGIFQYYSPHAPDVLAPYERAWMHTWLVAQAFSLFGLSTIAARSISIFCGVVFILSSFYIVRKLLKRTDIALLSAVLLLFNAELIDLFATVRLYALMMPLSLWMLYFIFKTLHREIPFKSDNPVTRWIGRRFNFHFGYAALAIAFIMLNNHITQNALVLLFGVAVYIIWKANELSPQQDCGVSSTCIPEMQVSKEDTFDFPPQSGAESNRKFIEERRPKFVTLSIVGAAALLGIGACFFAHVALSVEIPGISPYISRFLVHSGFGWNNIVYFWDNAAIPLGLFIGAPLLLVGLAFCIANRRANPFFLFASLCYLSTVVFFVFFADRYYTYRYMAFVAPVSAMLVALGYCGIGSKIGQASKRALLLLIALAMFGHMATAYHALYVKDPYRTYFSRPMQMAKNVAKADGLSIVPIYASLIRRVYADSIIGDYKIYRLPYTFSSRAENSGLEMPDIDYLLTFVDEDPIVFFFSELEHYYTASPEHRFFLENAVELINDMDNAFVYKYHFIEAGGVAAGGEADAPADLGTDMAGAENPHTLEIIDIYFEGDVAYLSCTINFDPAFSSAVFIGVEIAETGKNQSATHRFQVLLPDGFEGAASFTLPVRLKTVDSAEDISFAFSNKVYVYIGQDNNFMFEVDGAQ